MILAGLAFLGAGGFLFLNEMNALPDDLFSFSLPLLSAQKVTLKFSKIFNHIYFFTEKRFSSEGQLSVTRANFIHTCSSDVNQC